MLGRYQARNCPHTLQRGCLPIDNHPGQDELSSFPTALRGSFDGGVVDLNGRVAVIGDLWISRIPGTSVIVADN